MAYAAEFMLPQRRNEYYLAQISWAVATSMGGYDGSVSDFLIDGGRSEEVEEVEEDLFFSGFNPK